MRRQVIRQRQESFEELVTQYEKLVYTVCWQMVRDSQAAEDLTQDTFLAAFLHRSDCPMGHERQWLVRIASNKAKDYLQSAYHRHTVLPGDEEMPPGRAGPSPEEETLARSGESELRDLISTLREPYGAVLRLHLLEEKPPEEIALALGRPVKTVHTQIARGRLLLRQQLERRGIHGSIPK